MNDEIQEILYVLKHIVIGRASRLTCREADKLLNYITKLQQENKKLNEVRKIYEQGRYQEHLDYEDYKSRCEKANAELKNWEKLDLDNLLVAIRRTQNILQNGSEKND